MIIYILDATGWLWIHLQSRDTSNISPYLFILNILNLYLFTSKNGSYNNESRKILRFPAPQSVNKIFLPVEIMKIPQVLNYQFQAQNL